MNNGLPLLRGAVISGTRDLLGFRSVIPSVYPLPRPFSPPELDGLTVWCDASDSSTLAATVDGSSPTSPTRPVALVRDRAVPSVTSLTQSTSSSRPTMGVAPVNGLSAVAMNGTSAWLQGSWANTANVTPAYTNVVVCVPTSLTGVRPMLGGSNSDGSRNSSMQIRGGTWQIGTAVIANTGITARLEPTIIATAIDQSASSATVMVNGVVASVSGNIVSANSNGIFVGASGFGEFFAGQFCEFFRYRRLLSLSELLYVSRAMAAKWGCVLR